MGSCPSYHKVEDICSAEAEDQSKQIASPPKASAKVGKNNNTNICY